jgi:prepilin-type N-terminal cleavage/methylation domain-containing protein
MMNQPARHWHSRQVNRKMNNHGAGRRSGFTIIELIVVMAIVTLLAALTMPAIGQSRQAARRLQCQNNLRNIALGMLHVADVNGRFPASGNFGRDPITDRGLSYRSWVVDILPWIDEGPLAASWNMNLPIDDPANQPLTQNHLPVLVCPADISANGDRQPFDVQKGDLSYVVNGGVGFTIRYPDGVRDCPVDPTSTRLDLNGNGIACPADPKTDGSPSDKDYFFRLGLFFTETWKSDVTIRHHRIDDVVDGMSNTIVLSENVRTGFNPPNPLATWASPHPLLTSFYVGNPCLGAKCSKGNVDYARSNSGAAAINAGLPAPENTSPYPSSFHTGGVYFAFGDGRVQFVSQTIAGSVYAALCSPQGTRLAGTPLAQGVSSSGDF